MSPHLLPDRHTHADVANQAWAAAHPQHRVIWTPDHPAYPQAWRNLHKAPQRVWVQGRGVAGWREDHLTQQPSLAIVGTRNPTPQGLLNARSLAQTLCQAGICIVSGMALGIDGAAHEGALTVAARCTHPKTLAFVGTGIDQVYPRRHQALAHQIAQQGLILSEYPLGMSARPHHFPERNRLIAASVDGVLVVEAALGSGSLITAMLALEMGKEVFAVPGSIHSPLSKGCHALLREGATLVEQVEDVWAVFKAGAWAHPYGVMVANKDGSDGNGAGAASLQPADPWGLWPLLQSPVDVQTLSQISGVSIEQVLGVLTDWQLQARVSELPGGQFQSLHTVKTN